MVQKSAPSLLYSTYCICTLYTTATLLLVVCNLVYILLSNALHVFWGTDTVHGEIFSVFIRMIWQPPSPGHPSAADEAWYWPKHVPPSG